MPRFICHINRTQVYYYVSYTVPATQTKDREMVSRARPSSGCFGNHLNVVFNYTYMVAK